VPSVTISYVAPPSVSITSPITGATYHQGDVIPAAYTCTAGAGTTVSSCAGPVANGAPIDTSTPGPQSFRVTVQDQDGGTAASTVTYTVAGGAGGGGGSGGGGGGGGAVVPKVTGAQQTNAKWRETKGRRKKGPPVGTTFSFILDEPGHVTLSFTRSVGGRRVNGRCLAKSRRNRHRPKCSRPVLAGRFDLTGHQGQNTITGFTGTLPSGTRLPVGNYTLTITMTDAAGVTSAPQSLSFAIVAAH
jgi:hypothetical protein